MDPHKITTLLIDRQIDREGLLSSSRLPVVALLLCLLLPSFAAATKDPPSPPPPPPPALAGAGAGAGEIDWRAACAAARQQKLHFCHGDVPRDSRLDIAEALLLGAAPARLRDGQWVLVIQPRSSSDPVIAVELPAAFAPKATPARCAKSPTPRLCAGLEWGLRTISSRWTFVALGLVALLLACLMLPRGPRPAPNPRSHS